VVDLDRAHGELGKHGLGVRVVRSLGVRLDEDGQQHVEQHHLHDEDETAQVGDRDGARPLQHWAKSRTWIKYPCADAGVGPDEEHRGHVGAHVVNLLVVKHPQHHLPKNPHASSNTGIILAMHIRGQWEQQSEAGPYSHREPKQKVSHHSEAPENDKKHEHEVVQVRESVGKGAVQHVEPFLELVELEESKQGQENVEKVADFAEVLDGGDLFQNGLFRSVQVDYHDSHVADSESGA